MNRIGIVLSLSTLVALAGCASPSADQPASDEPELNSNQASLVVPLIDEKKKLLSRFNAQAKAKGLKELPDTFEVKNGADAQKLADLRSYFDDEIQPAVGAKDQAMPAWGPDSFTNWSKTNKTPGLCYRGNPRKVVGVIENGTDTMFSDQLVVHGWRYKAEKHFGDGAEDYEDQFPDVWNEWKGSGSAILVVASQSDDGDDLTPAIIPRCAK
jgi:hypothetical protein